MLRKGQNGVNQKEHAFLVLDGLRGVAAVSVMIYHYSGQLHDEFTPWLPNAFLAVDFFFVLSGFIVAYAYEHRLMAGEPAAQFMLRRFIRLYPLYWLGTTLPLLMQAAIGLLSGQSGASSCSRLVFPYILNVLFLPLLPSLLTTPTHTSIPAFPLNVAAWSLSVEVGVNGIYGVLGRRLKTSRLIVLVLISCIALASAIWTMGTPNMGWQVATYDGGWARAMWSFFLGVLLFRSFQSRQDQEPFPAWIGGTLAIGLFTSFAWPSVASAYALWNTIVVFPLIVWVGARTRIWRAAHRVYAWLGRVSYALYILHVPLFFVYVLISKRIGLHLQENISLSVFAYSALSLSIVSILDAAYDTPMRLLLARIAARHPLPWRKQ